MNKGTGAMVPLTARRARASTLLVLGALAGACVTTVEPKQGLGSFKVDVVTLPPFNNTSGCSPPSALGSRECPRQFPELGVPVAVHVRVRAYDRNGQPMRGYAGTAQIDVRPGMVTEVGPAGLTASFIAGEAELDLSIAQAFGATRLWVEDCGSGGVPGTFATGVSPEIWFDKPRLDQIQITGDNTTSPLIPRATNVCAISGDPRWGIGEDWGENALIGYANGKVDQRAGPAPIGNYLEIVGCGRAEFLQKRDAGQSCARGPLVVTAITPDGFYLTDVQPQAVRRGFNSIFVFNMRYPDDLVQGDVLTVLRGSPVEFSGSTQLGNPVWTKDTSEAQVDLMPTPIKVDPKVYQSALRVEKCSTKQFGGNNGTALGLEAYEGALVCFDRLAPASYLQLCDKNQSGMSERSGCSVGCNDEPPPLCSEGKTLLAPVGADCVLTETCLDLTAEELAKCALKGFVPSNPAEYCCERACLADPACADQNSFNTYGQWTAEIFGNYELDKYDAVKINVVTRDVKPDFDALKLGTAQRALPKAERKTVKVIGNLKQALGARPVWILMARGGANDIEVGGTCP